WSESSGPVDRTTCRRSIGSWWSGITKHCRKVWWYASALVCSWVKSIHRTSIRHQRTSRLAHQHTSLIQRTSIQAYVPEHGYIALQPSAGIWWIVAVLFTLAIALVLVYRSTRQYASVRDRTVSFGLRAGALLLLVLPLFEPVWVVPDVVPDEN